jgi:hypothetical protein
MYKVGDKVLMEVEIVSVDKDDEWLTYEIEFDDETYWVSPKDIYSALPKVSEEEVFSSTELKYKIGDKVYHKYKKEWGIGKIEDAIFEHVDVDYTDASYNTSEELYAPYRVSYPLWKCDEEDNEPDSSPWWTAESNIELVTEEKQNDQG